MIGMRHCFGLLLGINQLLPLSVKQFMLRTNHMAKCIVNIGYHSYVVNTEEAVALLNILGEAEVFNEKYEDKHTTYHVYPQELNGNRISMKLLPDSLYKFAKLAGKPEER